MKKRQLENNNKKVEKRIKLEEEEEEYLDIEMLKPNVLPEIDVEEFKPNVLPMVDVKNLKTIYYKIYNAILSFCKEYSLDLCNPLSQFLKFKDQEFKSVKNNFIEFPSPCGNSEDHKCKLSLRTLYEYEKSTPKYQCYNVTCRNLKAEFKNLIKNTLQELKNNNEIIMDENTKNSYHRHINELKATDLSTNIITLEYPCGHKSGTIFTYEMLRLMKVYSLLPSQKCQKCNKKLNNTHSVMIEALNNLDKYGVEISKERIEEEVRTILQFSADILHSVNVYNLEIQCPKCSEMTRISNYQLIKEKKNGIKISCQCRYSVVKEKFKLYLEKFVSKNADKIKFNKSVEEIEKEISKMQQDQFRKHSIFGTCQKNSNHLLEIPLQTIVWTKDKDSINWVCHQCEPSVVTKKVIQSFTKICEFIGIDIDSPPISKIIHELGETGSTIGYLLDNNITIQGPCGHIYVLSAYKMYETPIEDIHTIIPMCHICKPKAAVLKSLDIFYKQPNIIITDKEHSKEIEKSDNVLGFFILILNLVITNKL